MTTRQIAVAVLAVFYLSACIHDSCGPLKDTSLQDASLQDASFRRGYSYGRFLAKNGNLGPLVAAPPEETAPEKWEEGFYKAQAEHANLELEYDANVLIQE